MNRIMRFIKDEDGMELSEYAIIGGILLLGAVGIISVWGDNIATIFGNIRDEMGTAASDGGGE